MESKKLPIIAAIVFASIIVIIILAIVAVIGAMNLTDGCLYRYNFDDNGVLSTKTKVTKTVVLNANANYSFTTAEDQNSDNLVLDESGYGQWLNTNLRVFRSQKVDLSINGEVSLCKAYLPKNNLQQDGDTDEDGSLIPIPRVEDGNIPLTLYFDAKNPEWRNITELYPNDRIVVSILPDQKSSSPVSAVYNSILKRNISADCREGATSYSPICGRFSVIGPEEPSSTNIGYTAIDGSWLVFPKSGGRLYLSSCEWDNRCIAVDKCAKKCAEAFDKYTDDCDKCEWEGCYVNAYKTIPEPYDNSGKYIIPWSDDLNILRDNVAIVRHDAFFWNSAIGETGDGGQLCEDGIAYNRDESINFWFSADDAGGLLYRFYSGSALKYKMHLKLLGTKYNFSKIQGGDSSNNPDNFKTLLDTEYNESDVTKLQYRFYDYEERRKQNRGRYNYQPIRTGGYVLTIKHTKCRRKNGEVFDDTIAARGAIQYIIVPYGQNPNNDFTDQKNVNVISFNASGEASLDLSNANGYLWMKIHNDPNDYKNSLGQYNIQLSSTVHSDNFSEAILDKFFKELKSKVKNTAVTIFKNMTCYRGFGDADNCTNLFQYIKFILIVYIILYGMMFLLGIVKISQTDLIVRVIKIGIVSGLMNDRTFEFFNFYVFDLVTSFSDEIISNISGYTTYFGEKNISNPFNFLDEVMTKIFFSSTFAAQILALFSMGLHGLLYFILIFVCLAIVIFVSFRAMAVYLMAYVAIAVLIGIAPLFLTFILFQRTWYLFDNWVKFMTRYMLEPTIMLAGIIILMQLFTIYLDYVIGYSVCWKCGIPFKIPFPKVEGVTPAFLDVELFCINWFAPWGFDHRSASMGLNLVNMFILIIIVYCMWGYLDFSYKMVAKLAGGAGGPSATYMGKSMSRSIEQSTLSKVGLDDRTRVSIANHTKMRAKHMQALDKKTPPSMLPSIQERKNVNNSDNSMKNRSGTENNSTSSIEDNDNATEENNPENRDNRREENNAENRGNRNEN